MMLFPHHSIGALTARERPGSIGKPVLVVTVLVPTAVEKARKASAQAAASQDKIELVDVGR